MGCRPAPPRIWSLVEETRSRMLSMHLTEQLGAMLTRRPLKFSYDPENRGVRGALQSTRPRMHQVGEAGSLYLRAVPPLP
jgi:hypothetical protein